MYPLMRKVLKRHILLQEGLDAHFRPMLQCRRSKGNSYAVQQVMLREATRASTYFPRTNICMAPHLQPLSSNALGNKQSRIVLVLSLVFLFIFWSPALKVPFWQDDKIGTQKTLKAPCLSFAPAVSSSRTGAVKRVRLHEND